MSSTVRSYGLIAQLQVVVPEDDREGLTEKTYDDKSPIDLNYEGTLVYLDMNRHQKYDVREDFYGLFIAGEMGNVPTPEWFALEAEKYGLKIMMATVRPYNCIWYNGSDNPVDLLTLEEFKQKVGE